jgi:hypothetical protein
VDIPFYLGLAGVFCVLGLKIFISGMVKYKARKYKAGVNSFVYVINCHSRF